VSIAYLILAHNNPRHLARLVGRLSTAKSRCFVHVDGKASLEPFVSVKPGAPAEWVEPRVSIAWGGFSMIEATHLLIERALAHPERFERFVLLSGADYPLRSTAYIEEFFRRHADQEFINLVAMPSTTVNKPLSRLTNYRPDPGEARAVTLGRKVLQRVGVLPRKRDYKRVFGDLQPYAGSQWWALSRAACELFGRFPREQPEIAAFFRNTHCADEMYFQTIIGNSEFKTRQRRAVTFTDWSGGARSPAWLNESHVAKFRKSREFVVEDAYGRGEMLFARKCPEPSDEVVATLDAMIAEKDPLPESLP
jgi:hypothetical protein